MELTPQVLTRVRVRTLNYLRYKLNGNHGEIYEDAIQKAYFDLYQKKCEHSFNSELQICKWLCTASWRYALKELKFRTRQTTLDNLKNAGHDDDTMKRFEHDQLLDQFKSKLSLKKAEVIEKTVHGFSIAEIAKTSEEKQDTVKHRLNSARKTLRILWEST